MAGSLIGRYRVVYVPLLLLLAASCSQQQAVLAFGHAGRDRSQQNQALDLEPVQAPSIHLHHQAARHAQAPPTAPKPSGHHAERPQQAASSTDSSSSAAEIAHAGQPGSPRSPSGSRPRVPLLAVTVMSTVMALMSCLGVLPYFFCNKLSKPWAGVANAVASGVMLAASFGLLAEGAPYGGTYLIVGMLLGVVFVKFSQEHLEQYEVDSFEQLAGADARKVILFLAVMAVHAVGEGGGVGVSFAGDRGWAQGTLVTLAIGLHNVPEGLAVATVMAAKGTSPRRVLLWTALTALPQALVAPPAYVFVDTFRALLPLAMGFAAGCMIWVVLAELVPDALEAVDAERVATCATGSAAWLQGLSIWISHLETPAGTLASPFGNYQAVLPLGLAPLLPQLAPIVLVPMLLAAAAAGMHLPRPLMMSASAGLFGAYAGCCVLQLLLSSPQRLLAGMLAPVVGAAAAAALWRQLRSWQMQGQWLAATGSGCSSTPSSPLHVEAFSAAASPAAKSAAAAAAAGALMDDSCYDGDSSSKAGAYAEVGAAGEGHRLSLPVPKLGGQQQQGPGFWQQHEHAVSGVPRSGSYQVITASAVPYSGQTQPRHPHYSKTHAESAGWAAAQQTPGMPGWQESLTHNLHYHQSHQQHQKGGAAGSNASAINHSAWDTAQEHSGASSTCSSIHSSGYSPPRAAAAAARTASPLLLPGRGDLLLPVTRPDPARLFDSKGLGLSQGGRRVQPRHSWGFAGPDAAYFRSERSLCGSQAVTAASMLVLGGVAAAGAPLGLQLAAALTADPSSTGHVVLPMLLLGCVFGLGCLSFLLLLLGTRKQLLAAGAGFVSGMPVLFAVAALLSQPEWVQQGSARLVADALQGLTAGFNLFVVLMLLLPIQKQWGTRWASVGLWGGAVAGGGLCLGLAALCTSTPYCLHVHAIVS